MLFRMRFLDGIRKGDVTLAFRRWRRPSVREGGTLLTLIWGVWSEVVERRVALSEIHPMLLAFSAVVAAAVLAVPGYLVAALEEERLVSMRRAGRWWIRLSLAAGVVASVVAAPLTFFFSSWLWLFPAGTLVGCLALYLRSERLWRLAVDGG